MLTLSTNESFSIDQKHDVFAGSPYADSEFSVELKYLTAKEKNRIFKTNTDKKGNTDVIKASEDLFVTRVIGWSGIQLDTGDFPCSVENKRRLYNEFEDFVTKVLEAANEAEENRVGRTEAVKKP